MKNLEIFQLSSPVEVAERAAKDWLTLVPSFKKGHLVALSGGRIASHFYDAVTAHAVGSGVSFDQTHFFWSDERCVPPDHPDSNFRIAQKELLGPLGISPAKIHRLHGEMKPADAVAEANTNLGLVAPVNDAGIPILDLVLLGMGEDGHTASLFPKAPGRVVDVLQAFIAVRSSSKPPPMRISLSYAAIAAAKQVWVLVSGEGKEEVLRESLRLDGKTPLAHVLQSRQRTRIYTDVAQGEDLKTPLTTPPAANPRRRNAAASRPSGP